MVSCRETCEKSVGNEVQNNVTGEEKGVTRMTGDGIHGERLMWGRGRHVRLCHQALEWGLVTIWPV
jgi:hypothetical protein